MRQLLDHLVSKYRLALWIGYPQFYVRLSVADAQRLRPPYPELHSDVIIEDLGVEQLELVKRTCGRVQGTARCSRGLGWAMVCVRGVWGVVLSCARGCRP